jgi:hypothetical protein
MTAVGATAHTVDGGVSKSRVPEDALYALDRQ